MSDIHNVKQAANIMLYYTSQSYYAQRSGSVSIITDNRDSVLRRQRRIKTMFGVVTTSSLKIELLFVMGAGAGFLILDHAEEVVIQICCY